jgi:hypothetical protein
MPSVRFLLQETKRGVMNPKLFTALLSPAVLISFFWK